MLSWRRVRKNLSLVTGPRRAMAFAQPTNRESLSELEASFGTRRALLY